MNGFGAISNCGFCDSTLAVWTLLFNDKIFVPFGKNEYEAWVKSFEYYGVLRAADFHNWLIPIDDFRYSNSVEEYLDRREFIKVYKTKTNNSFRTNTSADQSFIELSYLLELAANEEVTVSLKRAEYALIGELTVIDSISTTSYFESDERPIIFPDLTGIDLPTIIKLRKSGFHKRFIEYCEELKILKDKSSRDNKVLIDLFETVSSVKPNLTETILKGIASNFPVEMKFNPASLAILSGDIERCKKLKKESGWLFFLSEVNAARGNNLVIQGPGGAGLDS